MITIHSDFTDIFNKIKVHNDFWGGDILMTILYDNAVDISNRKNVENFLITSYLDVLFLCVNLSLPGSLSIKSTVIFNNDFQDEINLFSGYLHSSFDVSLNYGGWPKIQALPLKEVVIWYDSLNIGLNIKAQNDLERTLF
ncbi:hypothetical protein [Hanstruepera flava]|uniref:hypothetical protein n=1 Tax=Hanstruepera flava TaxID=2930218 RepID=UPI002028E34E|nr:hypothetical protein [Hanstruepera flava]